MNRRFLSINCLKLTHFKFYFFKIPFKGLLTAVISSDPAIEETIIGVLDPEGTATLAQITGDLASGFDTIQNNYGDVLNDPNQESLNLFMPFYSTCYCIHWLAIKLLFRFDKKIAV